MPINCWLRSKRRIWTNNSNRPRLNLSLSQANLHLAETTDERWQELLKTASVTEQEAAEKAAGRETAAASVDADRANMRRLEELVAFQRVTAPFAGTITIRSVDIGDLIVAGSGGQELFHIAQTDKLRVYVRVPEPYALRHRTRPDGHFDDSCKPGPSVCRQSDDHLGSHLNHFPHTVDGTRGGQLATSNPALQLWRGQLQGKQYQSALDVALQYPAVSRARFASRCCSPGRHGRIAPGSGRPRLRTNHRNPGGVTPADRVITNPTDSLVDGAKVRIQAGR